MNHYTATLHGSASPPPPATFHADPDAAPPDMVRAALAALGRIHLLHHFPEPRRDGPATIAKAGALELRINPAGDPHRDPMHPLTAYHAAARYRLAHQADKDRNHHDPDAAARLATARAALRPGRLTYLARLDPAGSTATIEAPADASRRQLVQMAKAALRCTGHPFRPLEYIDPPRIEARAQGITLTIRPEPL